MTMDKGYLKWFDPSRGWGFCTRDDGSDVFLHVSCLERAGIREIADGTKVAFTTKLDQRGRRAIDVIELLA
jgi:cold shock protein